MLEGIVLRDPNNRYTHESVKFDILKNRSTKIQKPIITAHQEAPLDFIDDRRSVFKDLYVPNMAEEYPHMVSILVDTNNKTHTYQWIDGAMINNKNKRWLRNREYPFKTGMVYNKYPLLYINYYFADEAHALLFTLCRK